MDGRQNAIQRGAHLVAHHGEKAGFLAIGGQRVVARLHNVLFLLPLVGDVADVGNENWTICGPRQRYRKFGRKDAPVAVDHLKLLSPGFGNACFAGGQKASKISAVFILKVRRDQKVDKVLTKRSIARDMKDRFGRSVEVLDASVFVDDHDCIQRCAQHGRQP